MPGQASAREAGYHRLRNFDKYVNFPFTATCDLGIPARIVPFCTGETHVSEGDP